MSTSSASKITTKSTLLKKIFLSLFMLVVGIYIIIWAFSPVVVRYFAAQPLADINLSLSEASSVRYNPFTSTLSLDDVSLLDANQNQVLKVGEGEVSVHLHRMLLSQVYVSEFFIDDVEVAIVKEQNALFVAGVDLNAEPTTTDVKPEIEPTNDTKTSETSSAIDIILPELNINNVSINALVDGIEQVLVIDALAINDLLANQHSQNLSLLLKAYVNKAPLSFDTAIDLVDNKGQISANVSLKDFPLISISPLLAEQNIELAGTLSLQANPLVDITTEQIQINTEQITLTLNDLLLSAQSILVEGKSQVIEVNELITQLDASGSLQNINSNVGLAFSEGLVSIATKDNNLANWQGINTQAIINLAFDDKNVLAPNISVPSFVIDELHLSEALSNKQASHIEGPMLALGQLNVSDIAFTSEQLSINKIQLATLNTNIKVNADKSINGLVDTSALTPAQPQITEAQQTPTQEELPPNEVDAIDDDTTPLRIVLNTFELIEQGNIKVVDESVSPVFNQEIIIQTLTAGPFDSNKPEQKSPFELLMIDDNYLKIDAIGYVTPFAEKLNAEITAKVAELNLPSISPYVKSGLGFEMKTGQLDLTVKVNIENDEIDGNTNIFLRGMEMSSADEVEQGALKEGKAMPLNTALGMLKDGDGNIDLDVPMRGNIASPSFGIESFVTLIIKKAVMSQAKDYLMTTFVPYASVVSVAMSGAEFLLKVTFEPLPFNVTETELSAENNQFLSELALLMNDTPDLQIKTCAIVTFADIGIASETALNDQQKAQVKAMGDARQANLKRFLVDQGLASNRILYCAPELDTATDAIPRLELKTD